jgi:hypothetical protein
MIFECACSQNRDSRVNTRGHREGTTMHAVGGLADWMLLLTVHVLTSTSLLLQDLQAVRSASL